MIRIRFRKSAAGARVEAAPQFGADSGPKMANWFSVRLTAIGASVEKIVATNSRARPGAGTRQKLANCDPGDAAIPSGR